MACGNHLTTHDCIGTTASPVCTGWAAILRVAAAALGTWRERARQRRALRRLDERLLRDIGVTRAAAEREARAPFWRAGAGRRRRPLPWASPATAAPRFPIPSSERRRG
jgi:uncharacterized protein YjiS (DUF1127 family)